MPKALSDHLAMLSSEERLYLLENIPTHLVGASRAKELYQLLRDYEFIDSKIQAMGSESLIYDYNIALNLNPNWENKDRDPETLKTIQRVLQNASHILTIDRNQLASQLWGRLYSSKELGIRTLLKQASESSRSPWLRPISPVFEQAGGPLFRILRGHSDSINAFAITSDSKKIVSSSNDNTTKVWDLDSGELLHSLEGSHTALSITPDDRKIITGSKVWDLDSGELLHSLEGCDAAVIITPDCKKVISGPEDNITNVWDLDTGELLHTLGHYITAVIITPDGKKIITGSDDTSVKVWELEHCRLLYSLQGHKGAIGLLAITPDGRKVISASHQDYTLKVWDIEMGKLLNTITDHDTRVYTMAISSDSKHVEFLSTTGGFESFSIITGGGGHLPGPNDRIDGMALAPDGDVGAYFQSDKDTLTIWKSDSNEVSHTIGPTGPTTAVVITPDGKMVFSSSKDNTLKLWDAGKAELHSTFRHDKASTIAITPDGKKAVSGSEDGRVKVWDLKEGKELYTFRHDYPITTIAITPDGKKAVSGSEDGRVKVWDLKKGKLSNMLDNGPILKIIAITPDGKKAVSGSEDGRVKVWDLKEGKELYTFRHDYPITTIAITPDGKKAVSGSEDGRVKVWDLKEGKLLDTINQLFHHGFKDLRIAEDGNRAIYVTFHDYIYVWDIEKARLFRRYKADEKDLLWMNLKTSADGRIAISGNESTLEVWDVEKKEITQSMDLTNEQLTDEGGRVRDRYGKVAITPDGKKIVSDSHDELMIWSLDIQSQRSFSFGRDYSVYSLTLVKNRDQVVVESKDKPLTVWDMNTGKEKNNLNIPSYAERFDTVTASDDGRFIITSDTVSDWYDRSTSMVTNLVTGNQICQFGSEGTILGITRDSQRVYTILDNALKVWDLSGNELQSWKYVIGDGLQILSDEERAIAISENALKVWELEYGTKIWTMKDYPNYIQRFAVAQEAQRVLSVSSNHVLILWDLEFGKKICTMHGHRDAIRDVSITPDGRRAVSVSDDRTLRIWDLNACKTIALLYLDVPYNLCGIARDGVHIVAGGGTSGLNFFLLEGA